MLINRLKENLFEVAMLGGFVHSALFVLSGQQNFEIRSFCLHAFNHAAGQKDFRLLHLVNRILLEPKIAVGQLASAHLSEC